jgi:NAD(P)-dependent dehydrogenase (short-subunit alcohol dehydrogenase family)
MVADDAKVILVTGSSRGLGKSIAMELGKCGQKVVINYVSDGSKESAEKTVEEIKALGGDAFAIQADSKYSTTVGSYGGPGREKNEKAKKRRFFFGQHFGVAL